MSMADAAPAAMAGPAPFASFAPALRPPSTLRAAITAHTRAPEPECVAALLREATLPPETVERARALALRLAGALRAKGTRGPVEGLVREYDLSSQEGVALMCLAEALLRIPDRATRDALIRDKIGAGDWRGHLGHSPSLFVNAATWGLVVTGRLTARTAGEAGLGAALTRLIARGGEPLIRRGVDMAMRMMGEQFVTGQTIDEALRTQPPAGGAGFRYSYDMLGEAADTAADAARYLARLRGGDPRHRPRLRRARRDRGPRHLGQAVGAASALLPPAAARVMAELLPRLRALALLARATTSG